MASTSDKEVSEFEWIQLRSDIGLEELKNEETGKEKFKRKFYENPFVPVGFVLTAEALTYGLWSMRKGKARMSQNMMRVRIGAQGFTIVALLVGCATSGYTMKR